MHHPSTGRPGLRHARSARTITLWMAIAIVFGIASGARAYSVPVPSDTIAVDTQPRADSTATLPDAAQATATPAADNDAPEFRKNVQWAFRRFGPWVVAIIVFALIWWKWDEIKKRPGVARLLSRRRKKPLPQATPGRFTILVAELENDTKHEHENLIIEAIREFEGVDLCRLGRTVTFKDSGPDNGVAAGHEKARAYLKKTGAHVLIWGTVLTRDKTRVPKLYLTPAPGVDAEKQHGRYAFADDLTLPAVFWEDLRDVLRLLVVTAGNLFVDQRGQFIADRLEPFTDQVRGLLKAVDPAHGWDSDSCARVSRILGISLSILGEQGGQDEPLHEAVRLYREVSEVFTRERAPFDWALTQNNLGAALTKLGDREADTTKLKEAVATYEEALTEQPREHVPLDWAMTQNNLGNALAMLGQRESGTNRLKDAVTAYKLALREFTRDRIPLDWAMTQNNLGNALWILGEREGDTYRLEEAAAAYKNALEEYTRERAPLRWATTQSNLGNALVCLGERESDTTRLEEAVATYREALRERTRERVPLQWATTQNNLGNALALLGERESSTVHFEEAVIAYNEALREHTRERDPLRWGTLQNNLGNALRNLGERESGTARLEEAVTAYNEALEEHTCERVPLNWAMTQSNLGNALQTIGERTDDIERVCGALGAHLSAWGLFSASTPEYASREVEKIARDLTLLKEKFPPSEVEACLKKHETLLQQFFAAQQQPTPDDDA